MASTSTLPTLPDPYVASYNTHFWAIEKLTNSPGCALALAGFVKWPDPAEIERGEAADDPAYVYFKFRAA